MSVLASRRHDGVVSVRRVVNDHIADIASRCEPYEGDLFDFMCECGDLRCPEFVPLTVAEYRETVPGWVRAH